MTYSQQCSPQIISSAGTSFSGSNSQIEYTLGEPVISTYESTSVTLTQGFHQTRIIISRINENQTPISEFKVFPNPANDFIYVETGQKEAIIKIVAISGQEIRKIHINKGKTKIELSDLSQGIYLIKANEKEYYKLLITK